jgi:hypothetical protein
MQPTTLDNFQSPTLQSFHYYYSGPGSPPVGDQSKNLMLWDPVINEI